MRFFLGRKGRFALVDFRRTLSTLISFDEVHVRDKSGSQRGGPWSPGALKFPRWSPEPYHFTDRSPDPFLAV